MRKCNPENERIKRKYFEWQKEANRKGQSTIDNIRKAISRFEQYNQYKDFKTFNKDQAVAFKKHLTETKSLNKQEPLSKSTLLSTMRNLKDFFKWLAYQKGYKKIDIWQIEYLNPSEKDTRIAQSPRRTRVATIEQIKKVIHAMPASNDIEFRNRALVAFTLLTGIRDSAIASLRLKHINLNDELVEQRGAEVKTKFSKTIYTYFFPVGEEIKQIIIEWVNYLYKERLFNGDDPIFPRTKLKLNEDNYFAPDGIEPKFWQSANQIRKIFKEAFENAEIEYFTPHSFRDTLTRLGENLCKTPEEFKAWSQNLGHEQVLTTFYSYGYVEEYHQGQIIKSLANRKNQDNVQLAKILENAAFLLKHQTQENH